MIYLSLPDFFDNYYLIKFLVKIPNKFYNQELSFSSVEGNFPSCYWNGGFNNNLNNHGVLYANIFDVLNTTNIPLRFTCNNIYMQEYDLDDSLGNLILSLGENGSNEISISNINFQKKLKEKYPNYHFILSKEANLIYPMTPEIINTINEQDIFSLIQISEQKAKDFDFLNKIQKRKKIEIPLYSTCQLNCYDYKTCRYHEHAAQYEYSGVNNFFSCNKRKIESLVLKEDLKKYLDMGFRYFSLPLLPNYDINTILNTIVDLFIKEEYQLQVLKDWAKEKMILC